MLKIHWTITLLLYRSNNQKCLIFIAMHVSALWHENNNSAELFFLSCFLSNQKRRTRKRHNIILNQARADCLYRWLVHVTGYFNFSLFALWSSFWDMAAHKPEGITAREERNDDDASTIHPTPCPFLNCCSFSFTILSCTHFLSVSIILIVIFFQRTCCTSQMLF